MGYTEKERVQVKLEFLRMVSRMKLDPAKTALLYGFFETYLKLNEKEEQQMRDKISELPEAEATRVLELPNSYYEKGLDQGKEQGIEQGIEQGLERGREQAREESALTMLKDGLSVELVAKYAELPVKKVRELQRNMSPY